MRGFTDLVDCAVAAALSIISACHLVVLTIICCQCDNCPIQMFVGCLCLKQAAGSFEFVCDSIEIVDIPPGCCPTVKSFVSALNLPRHVVITLYSFSIVINVF